VVDEVTTSRGILMGEPLAKVVLLLLNATAEMAAYREWYRISGPVTYRAPEHIYVCGGDDFVARGDKGYLALIRRNILEVGNQLSPEKDAFGKVAIHYCERVLNLSADNLARDKSDPESLYVDIVKLRLLVRNDSIKFDRDEAINPAVGKATQLAGDLRFHSRDRPGWVNVTRNLFIRNMGGYLPKKQDHKAYASVFLPRELGGCGLGFKWELAKYVNSAYGSIRRLVNIMLTDPGYVTKCELILRDLSTLTNIRSKRGITVNEIDMEIANGFIDDFTGMYPKASNSELTAQYAQEDAFLTRRAIKDAGWVSTKELREKFVRSSLFLSLMTVGPTTRPKRYQPPWVTRYKQWDRKWWPVLKDYPNTPIGVDQESRLRGKLAKFDEEIWFNPKEFGEELEQIYTEYFQYIERGVVAGRPSMVVPWRQLFPHGTETDLHP